MKTPKHTSLHRFHSPSTFPCWILSLAACLCLGGGTLLGADAGAPKNETKKEVKKEQAKSGSDEKVVITGSLIPQKGKLNRIPLTTSPVIVISRTDIERSGATTLSEVLKRQGASR